jgi:hypothetical protein
MILHITNPLREEFQTIAAIHSQPKASVYEAREHIKSCTAKFQANSKVMLRNSWTLRQPKATKSTYTGWRAANTGTQTIRLLFDHPQRLSRISLVFEETETARAQKFVLRCSPDGGRSFREIVRQQWNFSPPDTIREVEEYRVEISDVTVLELVIVLTSVEERVTPRSRVCACRDLA